jgi:hypothetical protein
VRTRLPHISNKYHTVLVLVFTEVTKDEMSALLFAMMYVLYVVDVDTKREKCHRTGKFLTHDLRHEF